jgi:hypothetical protein
LPACNGGNKETSQNSLRMGFGPCTFLMQTRPLQVNNLGTFEGARKQTLQESMSLTSNSNRVPPVWKLNALPLISHVRHLGGPGKKHEYPHSCQPATSVAIIYLSKRSQARKRPKIIDKDSNNSVQKINVPRTGNLLHHVAISRVSVFISAINIPLRTVNAWRCRIFQQQMTSGHVTRAYAAK